MNYKIESIDREGEYSRIDVTDGPFSFSRDMSREEALGLAEKLIRTSFCDRDFRNSETSEWLDETFPFLEAHFVDGDSYSLEDSIEFTDKELNGD